MIKKIEICLGKGIKGYKTLWEKEKMPVTSIFSFPHNVFKGLFPRVDRYKTSLCGKEFSMPKIYWLVVLRFNATLTAKVISRPVGDA